MNNTVCKFVLFTLISFNLYQTNAQYPITIYTPRGSSVYAHTRPELMDYQDKLDCSEYVETYYPQATELNPPSATTTYNCHSYAWHKSEGGTTCTLAYYYGDTNESIYWTDLSYIETTEAYASKISYTSDNHSAIQTSTQGIYISKWGDYPLMQHARNYGPYNMSSRDYYKLNPGVNGSSAELCYNQERTFTSNTSISGSTYSWTKDNSLLDYVSGAGTTSYRVKAKNGNGKAWLRIQITTPSGEIALSPKKYTWVGKPDPYILGPDEVECYWPEWYFIDADSYQWGDWQWSTDYNMEILSVTNGHKAEIQGLSEGYGQIFLEATNECGSNENRLVVWVDCFDFKLIPNPADEYLRIELDNSKIQESNNIDYEIIIFDNQQRPVTKTRSKNLLTTINTGSLSDGVYYVQIIYKGKLYTKQLIIQH